MKRSLTLIACLILIACLLPSNPLIAEETKERPFLNRHTGPYAEVNVGSTLVWAAGDFSGSNFSDSGFIGTGWSIGGGYMFLSWIGAEAGFIKLLNVDIGDEDVDASVDGFYLTSRFNIPIKERFSFILKIGAMSLSFSANEVSVEDVEATVGAPFTGIGVSYALTDNIDLRAQFQGPNLIFVGAGVVSGGIAYRF